MDYKKVIPCLDVMNGRVVKGINFVNLRDVGCPVEMAAVYESEGADEVVLLDINATHEGRKTAIAMAARAADKLSIPFVVGGGFKDLEGAHAMMAAGANKISVNSAAVCEPQLLTSLSDQFGKEAVVCAIDAKQTSSGMDKWTVLTGGGRTNTGLDVIAWAVEAAKRGAGEILLTSLDCDGAQDGYDLALTRAVARAVAIPVTASGGVGKLEHFAEGILEGEASAVLAASVFHFGQFRIREVKEYMAAQGISVRL
ncbi:MAG: imidazole glycerol phosphate synthase subunit HisF [Coriobacteriia bacterium]|nr:imidazole glycerol phosphate synthase subunit HisF [Coriobacteriia bacterium]